MRHQHSAPSDDKCQQTRCRPRVPSHLARFLLEFTPIYDPIRVFTVFPRYSPIFARIFGAIWGAFDEVRARYGRFLPENGRISAPPCTGPGEQTLHVAHVNHRSGGPSEGVYGMCTGMYGFCTVLVRFLYGFCGKTRRFMRRKSRTGTRQAPCDPRQSLIPPRLCAQRGSTREIKGLRPQAGPVRRRGIRTPAGRATPLRK